MGVMAIATLQEEVAALKKRVDKLVLVMEEVVKGLEAPANTLTNLPVGDSAKANA